MTSVRLATAPPACLFTLETDQWTAPFWGAAAEHRLVAPRCGDCGTFRMPPTPFCPACHSQRLEWPVLSGKGTLYSYTVVDRAIIPEMEPSLPYVPAVVELSEAGHVRLISNVIDVALAELRVGLALRVAWVDRDDGIALPCFRPDDGER
jgi:uncharacterized OB-fold protein